MTPTYREGRIVIARTFFRAVKTDDIVIVLHDGLEKIKRVRHVRGRELFIVGDNEIHSTDSRDYGWLSKDTVVAKVLF